MFLHTVRVVGRPVADAQADERAAGRQVSAEELAHEVHRAAPRNMPRPDVEQLDVCRHDCCHLPARGQNVRRPVGHCADDARGSRRQRGRPAPVRSGRRGGDFVESVHVIVKCRQDADRLPRQRHALSCGEQAVDRDRVAVWDSERRREMRVWCRAAALHMPAPRRDPPVSGGALLDDLDHPDRAEMPATLDTNGPPVAMDCGPVPANENTLVYDAAANGVDDLPQTDLEIGDGPEWKGDGLGCRTTVTGVVARNRLEEVRALTLTIVQLCSQLLAGEAGRQVHPVAVASWRQLDGATGDS